MHVPYLWPVDGGTDGGWNRLVPRPPPSLCQSRFSFEAVPWDKKSNFAGRDLRWSNTEGDHCAALPTLPFLLQASRFLPVPVALARCFQRRRMLSCSSSKLSFPPFISLHLSLSLLLLGIAAPCLLLSLVSVLSFSVHALPLPSSLLPCLPSSPFVPLQVPSILSALLSLPVFVFTFDSQLAIFLEHQEWSASVQVLVVVVVLGGGGGNA